MKQTVREALDEKRVERQGTVTELVLCKNELFYMPQTGYDPEHTVYPVTETQAEEEAKWFGVEWSVQ